MIPMPGAVSGMHIIPVIDLLDGLAVHARHGLRSRYRPVATRLCPDPDPLAVLGSFLSLYPFRTVYVADLNAIQNTGENERVVREMMAAFRGVEYWLDAGTATLDRVVPGLRPVLGTESGITPDQLAQLHGTRPILSLDFSDTGLLGSRDLLRRPESWPEEVILMTLHKVGSEAGPALELCREIHALTGGHKRLYLAGGARDAADVRSAAESGASGMLVATSLHSRALDPAALPGV